MRVLAYITHVRAASLRGRGLPAPGRPPVQTVTFPAGSHHSDNKCTPWANYNGRGTAQPTMLGPK
jgi:hypothetical protein